MVLDFAGSAGAEAVGASLAALLAKSYTGFHDRKNRRQVTDLAAAIEVCVRGEPQVGAALDENPDLKFALLHFLNYSFEPFIAVCLRAKQSATWSEIRGIVAERLENHLVLSGVELPQQVPASLLVSIVGEAVDTYLEIFDLEIEDSRDSGNIEAIRLMLGKIASDLDDFLHEQLPASRMSPSEIAVHTKRRASSLFQAISLPDLSQARVANLSEIYVEPTLVGAEGRTLASELHPGNLKHICVGNPGAGKSTLLRYLGGRACRDPSSPIPLLVELRYRGEQLSTGESLLNILESTFEEHFRTELPTTVFESLVAQGHILVMLDGLDEVASRNSAAHLLAQLHNFVTEYQSAPIVVTSRTIGYDPKSVPDALSTISLQDLSDSSVASYCDRWFEYTGQPNRTVDFFRDSEAVAELRQNPLMLALLCIVYTSSGHYIPEDRARLYEHCAKLLFREWDRYRHVTIGAEFDDFLQEALEELAYTFFDTSSEDDLPTDGRPSAARTVWRTGARVLTGLANRVGVELVEETRPMLGESLPSVTADQATQSIASYLEDWHESDISEAYRISGQFVDFCRDRLWIITEVGRGVDNEPLISFVHRTFLEYYMGVRVARTMTARGLARHVRSSGSDPSARPTLEVALQIKTRSSRGTPDTIVNHLLKRGPVTLRTPAFASLQLVNSSVSLQPRTVGRIADLLIDELESSAQAGHHRHSSVEALLGVLCSGKHQNVRSAQNYLIHFLSENTSDRAFALARWLFDLRVRDVVDSSALRFPVSDTVRFTDSVSRFVTVLIETVRETVDLAPTLIQMTRRYAGNQGVVIPDILQSAKGFSGLFEPFEENDERGGMCLADSMLISLFDEDIRSRLDEDDWAFVGLELLGNLSKSGDLRAVLKRQVPLHWVSDFVSSRQFASLRAPEHWMVSPGDKSVGYATILGALAIICTADVLCQRHLGDRWPIESLGYSSFHDLGDLLAVARGDEPSDLNWEQSWPSGTAEVLASTLTAATSWSA